MPLEGYRMHKPGEFILFHEGNEKDQRFGRVMKVLDGKLHVQLFFTASETALGGDGHPGQLFSTSHCENVRSAYITRKVTVRGPLDDATDDNHDYYYQYRYNSYDGSFERDLVFYSGDGNVRDACQICTTRCADEASGPSFYVSQSMLCSKGPRVFYHIEGLNVLQPFKVGAFFVTKEDHAQYPWRQRIRHEEVARPPIDGVQFTEAWRIPKKQNRNVPLPQYKTVCRVTAITLDGMENRRLGKRQRVESRDVLLTVKLYVRPSDIGERQNCPYEVIETKQVAHLTGLDVEQLVEVKFQPSYAAALGWIERGLHRGQIRFHFAQRLTKTTSTVQAVNPKKAPKFVAVEMRLPPKAKMRSLDLFAGCGGLSSGLHAAGLIDCKWAVENDKEAAKAFKANFPGCEVFEEDVTEWFKNLKERPGDRSLPQPGKVDLVCGGPPCQGYSLLNRHKGSKKAAVKRGGTKVFIDVCMYLMPRFIIIENVGSFVTDSKGKHMQKVLNRLIAHHYQVRFSVLQAAAHGVPQRRRRTFLVAAAMGEILPKLPSETFFSPVPTKSYNVGVLKVKGKPQGPVLYPSQGVEEAIGDLADVPSTPAGGGVYGPRMSVLQTQLRRGGKEVSRHQAVHKMSKVNSLRATIIPEGGDWRWLPNEVMSDPDRHVSLRKLAYEGVGRNSNICPCKLDTTYTDCKRPSKPTTIPWLLAHTAHKNGHWRGALGRLHQRQLFPTIVTKPAPMRAEGRILHPTKDRFVTIRELARAQTFPDSFVLDPKRVYALKQIGNAVPPLLAEGVGRAILQSMTPK